MKATNVVERAVAAENKIGKLESDVSDIRTDVAEIRVTVRSLEGKVGVLESDVKSLTGAFYSFKAEVAKEFGAVRNEISKAKIWMLCTGVSTVLGVAAIVGLKVH